MTDIKLLNGNVMSNLFKDIYNQKFYSEFSRVVNSVVSDFSIDEFNRLIFTDLFDAMELKERMAHTSNVLHGFLSADFKQASEQLIDIITALEAKGIKEQSVEYMFFPHYIEQYGIDDLDNAIIAFERITQFTSAEFAVRPFLIRYPDLMLTQMIQWAKHSHASVRRLASEGSRPRLPWAIALPTFKKNPQPLLIILDTLKNDVDEVVRRSVANNLNDIAKDNPDFVVQFAQANLGETLATDKLIKHACRTLLKQGNSDVLALYGLSSDDLSVNNLILHNETVKVGGELTFEFELKNYINKARIVRIEYAIHYLKKNGSLAPKVFKISERELGGKQTLVINRKQSFKIITTRVFHLGQHQVSIIVNGKTFISKDFRLI